MSKEEDYKPAAALEAVAWFTDDHLSDKSATTYDASVAERWRAKGWPVTPLYAAPVAAAQEAVAYLDIGAGGYLDLGSNLPEVQLSALPKGRHALGIIGTYGIDGYVAAPVAAAQEAAYEISHVSPMSFGGFCAQIITPNKLERGTKLYAAAAPGIDLEQFRAWVEACEDMRAASEECDIGEGLAHAVPFNLWNEFLSKLDAAQQALDASPKGGSDLAAVVREMEHPAVDLLEAPAPDVIRKWAKRIKQAASAEVGS